MPDTSPPPEKKPAPGEAPQLAAPLPVPLSDRQQTESMPPEVGGRKEGREATRYGTWESNGRDIDF